MRSRSYKFTGKVVPPTAGPVPPATWNRGLRSRRGPAAVPPIVIAYFRTRKHCQVYCRVRHGIVVIPMFRCPPAAVPPRGIAWVPTQKQHQVFAGTWWSNHHGHVGVEYINADISKIENQLLSLNTRPNSMRSNRDSHTIGSNNEYDTPDKCIHRTLPNIHNDWQRNRNIHNLARTAENIHRYVHGNLITMNMQVSYAKHPIQNEARPHKIQVHLAPNGSQRQTTLIRIIKAHWRNTTPSHTHIKYFPLHISSGAFWTTRGAIWDVALTSAWFHGPGNGAWFRLEKRSRHVGLPCNFSKHQNPFLSDSDCMFSCCGQTNCRDEFDDSSGEETEADICQLWNLDFRWVHERTPQVDSNLLCGNQWLVRISFRKLHIVSRLFNAVWGTEVEGDTPVSQDLVSSNCLSNQIAKKLERPLFWMWKTHFLLIDTSINW